MRGAAEAEAAEGGCQATVAARKQAGGLVGLSPVCHALRLPPAAPGSRDSQPGFSSSGRRRAPEEGAALPDSVLLSLQAQTLSSPLRPVLSGYY